MLPTHRQSPGRTRRRRSHHGLRGTHTVLCPSCGEVKKPHFACGHCGYVRPGLKLELSGEED